MAIELVTSKTWKQFDYTMLSTYQTCQRKFYWRYIQNLVPKGMLKSPALEFGRAVHAALDSWYTQGDPLVAIACFDAEWDESLADDKRNKQMGHKVLRAYFQQYQDQPVKCLGSEVSFSFPLTGIMTYCGRIDKIIEFAGQVMVMDHKTTSRISADYFKTLDPNMQFDGYVWAAQKLGHNCTGCMIDAILVAKTKTENMRDSAVRTSEQLNRFEVTASRIVDEITCKSISFLYTGINDVVWLMNMGTCVNYNFCCPYMKLCRETNLRVIESMLQYDYDVEEWNPLKTTDNATD